MQEPSIYFADIKPKRFGGVPSGLKRVDIAVVGSGFSGLSAALNLAERGYSVHVFEAEYIGYGASGRNGGHICQGWSIDFSRVAKYIEPRFHQLAWEVGLLGREVILERCKKYNINAELRFGYLHGALHKRQMNELLAMQKEWQAQGYTELELLKDSAALTPYIKTNAYIGGLYDHASGHLHPLKYLYGLAEAAVKAGAKIYEGAKIIKLERGKSSVKLHHQGGVIEADRVVLAGNAYLASGVAPSVMKKKLASVASGIIALEPIDEASIEAHLPSRAAVADCNTALNYFRFDERGRLLFGGRASYTGHESGDISVKLKKQLRRVFPALADRPIESCWWGKIGITLNRLPHFGKIGDRIWFVQGYSGQGVALSGVAGLLIAEAIADDGARFDAFSGIRHLPFPGGVLRTPLLVLGMAWYKMRDSLRI